MGIPVYINHNEAGQLRISQDGLYTVLETEIPGCGGLVRLWAHGEGISVCLGVMQPWSGGLWLRRKLSRNELAAFPDPIEYVSDRAENEFTENSKHKIKTLETSERGDKQNSLHNINDGSEKRDIKEDKRDLHNNATEEEKEAESLKEDLHNTTTAQTCPWPAEPPETGLLWYSRPDGSLVAFDGISSLVALPVESRARFPKAAERVIEGKKYLVFRY